MKLNELIRRASMEYPDGLVEECWDSQSEAMKPYTECAYDVGDGLAYFIASELADTFNADLDEHEQLMEAAHVIGKAAEELTAVSQGLLGSVRFRTGEEHDDD